jgi:hypothetical protein
LRPSSEEPSLAAPPNTTLCGHGSMPGGVSGNACYALGTSKQMAAGCAAHASSMQQVSTSVRMQRASTC